jgi:hypothetical protein
MNRTKLIEKLDLLGVREREYSLYGNLNPDAIILYPNYNKWEVFYLDERGGRNDQKEFMSESEACEHVYKIFKASKQIENKFKLNS